MSTEAVTGAATGAAKGFVVAGPAGAVVGAVVGGLSGLFGGKSKKYARRARREQRAMAHREAAVQRRDMVRQFRIMRAQAIAASASESGGLTSSAPQGAIGSLASQANFNLQFFNQQAASQDKINSLLGKAEKYAGYSSLVGSLGNAALTTYDVFKRPDAYGRTGTTPTQPATQPGFETFPLPDREPLEPGSGRGILDLQY